MSAIHYWDGIRLDLDVAVVMPDHVHLIFRLLGGPPLKAVLQSIKGYSARGINCSAGGERFGSIRVSSILFARSGSGRRKSHTYAKTPPTEVWSPVGASIHGCRSKNDRLESLSHSRVAMHRSSISGVATTSDRARSHVWSVRIKSFAVAPAPIIFCWPRVNGHFAQCTTQ
jgi:hypothetical protein